MPQTLSAQFVCPSPKFLDFNEKRLHWASVVRAWKVTQSENMKILSPLICTANFRPVEHLNPWKVWYRNFSLHQSFYRSKVPSIRVDMVVTCPQFYIQLLYRPHLGCWAVLKEKFLQRRNFCLTAVLFETSAKSVPTKSQNPTICGWGGPFHSYVLM